MKATSTCKRKRERGRVTENVDIQSERRREREQRGVNIAREREGERPEQREIRRAEMEEESVGGISRRVDD